MFNVVLVHPDIPHNTGAIGRLCLATSSKLHLIQPLGFQLDEKAVRRAGLDYWKEVNLELWDSIEDFLQHLERTKARFHLLTTKTENPYWQTSFQAGDYLLFGSETAGLPESLLRAHPSKTLTIPMEKGKVRSLNLATAAGIVLYDAVRQVKTR